MKIETNQEIPVIYNNIRRLSEEKQISVFDIEKRAGLSNGAIGKWKTLTNPKIGNVQAVADVLGVPIDELLKD